MNLLLLLRLPSHFSEDTKVRCTESLKNSKTHYLQETFSIEKHLGSQKSRAVRMLPSMLRAIAISINVNSVLHFGMILLRPSAPESPTSLLSPSFQYGAIMLITIGLYIAIWCQETLKQMNKSVRFSLTLQAVYICAPLTDIVIAGM